jgi:hypothetical protein
MEEGKESCMGMYEGRYNSDICRTLQMSVKVPN